MWDDLKEIYTVWEKGTITRPERNFKMLMVILADLQQSNQEKDVYIEELGGKPIEWS